MIARPRAEPAPGQKNRIRVFEIAAAVADGKSTMPILACARLRWDRLEATDLGISYSAEIQTDQFVPDAIVVDAQKLAEVWSEDAALRAGADFDLDVGPFRLIGLDPGDFPKLPRAPDHFESIDGEDLRRDLARVLHCAGADETRFHLLGIRLEKTRLVATDGHRLAIADTGRAWPTGLIPTRAAEILISFLEDRGRVEIGFDGPRLFARTGNEVLSIRILESGYPNYNAAIPGESATSAVVDRRNLLEALERASICAGSVDLLFEHRCITISAEGEGIEFREEIYAQCAGPSADVRFHARYVVETLEQISTEYVSLGVGVLEPMVAQSHPQDEFLGIIMPMRK